MKGINPICRHSRNIFTLYSNIMKNLLKIFQTYCVVVLGVNGFICVNAVKNAKFCGHNFWPDYHTENTCKIRENQQNMNN